MAVYVDNAARMYKGRPRHHMTADSLAELHEFASRIGVRRCWLHRARRHPHYDISDEQRERAVAHGASAVSTRLLLGAAKRLAEREPLKHDADHTNPCSAK